MRQAYDYWQDQPGYYQTNADPLRETGTEAPATEGWLAGETESITIGNQLETQWESSFQYQAYNCDWEAGPTQATRERSSCASEPVPAKAERWDSNRETQSECDQTLETFVRSQATLLIE